MLTFVSIADAQKKPSYGNFASGFIKRYSRLRMASSFSSSRMTGLTSLSFQANLQGQLCKVWDGLHVSPRTAPSQRAKLCPYFAWFLRPGQLKTVPYFEPPMHFQATAADASPQWVSCFASGTGKAW